MKTDQTLERLHSLGYDLRGAAKPAANYSNSVVTGNLMFLSGKAAINEDGSLPTGKLGRDFTKEDGKRFCKMACLELLKVIKEDLKDLDQVAGFVEVQGFLNTTDDFEDHAYVLDGASDFLFEVFGERGKHARSVVGATSLRKGVPVVLRAVVELGPEHRS